MFFKGGVRPALGPSLPIKPTNLCTYISYGRPDNLYPCIFSCSELESMHWTTLKGTEKFYTYMKVSEVRNLNTSRIFHKSIYWSYASALFLWRRGGSRNVSGWWWCDLDYFLSQGGGGVLQPSKCRTTLAIKGGGVATPIHRQCDERKIGVHEYWLIVQIIGLVILRLNYQIISVHNILVKQTKHNKNIEDSLLEK